MTAPSDEEISKAIAEFMGESLNQWDYEHWDEELIKKFFLQKRYVKSLDALIPVVEKLDKPLALNYEYTEKDWLVCDLQKGFLAEDKSPSRALALAIYEVINEGQTKDDDRTK